MKRPREYFIRFVHKVEYEYEFEFSILIHVACIDEVKRPIV